MPQHQNVNMEIVQDTQVIVGAIKTYQSFLLEVNMQ